MSRIKPQLSPSGTNSMLSFLTGALDVAYMGSSPFVLSHCYDLPLRIISVANAYDGSLAVLKNPNPTRSQSNEDTIKIGTTLGSDGQILGKHFSEERHEGDLVFVNLSPEECVDAISTGLIDYAALWEPFVTILQNKGAEKVFTDQDLSFNMYHFIVASETSISSSTDSLIRFIKLHLDSIEKLNRNVSQYITELKYIFGPDISESRYKEMLFQEYEWPKYNFLSELNNIPESLEASLLKISETHYDLDNGDMISPNTSRFFPDSNLGDGDADTLSLGYSKDIMCTTFHVADLSNSFSTYDLSVESSGRRVEERIALLDEEWQNDVKLCHELIPRDPELVVQKIGRMNEKIFRKIEKHLIGETPNSIAAAIQSLRDKDLVPRDVLSWADSIRSIRNVATHDNENIAPEEARNTFNIFLNLLEWYESEADDLLQFDRCPRCYYQLEEGWTVCPRCGNSLEEVCPACGQEVQNEWQACPNCGSEL